MMCLEGLFSMSNRKSEPANSGDGTHFDGEYASRDGVKAPAPTDHKHGAIQRKKGRPRIGKGARRVQVTLEGDLLERADRYVKIHGITRSQLIARGIERILAEPV
jgi:hypothetical protein